ncbi:MAG TPA: hypothetical protein VHR55_08235 [Candidatus Limnocylindria bacterium]|nr:hypothetical protein [Candidatus Limnocylindria bacterium]
MRERIRRPFILVAALVPAALAAAPMVAAGEDTAHVRIALTLQGDVNPGDGFFILRVTAAPQQVEWVCAPAAVAAEIGPEPLPLCEATTYVHEFDVSRVSTEGDPIALTYGIGRHVAGDSPTELNAEEMVVYEDTITIPAEGDLNLSLTYEYPGSPSAGGSPMLPDTALQPVPPTPTTLPGLITLVGGIAAAAAWAGTRRWVSTPSGRARRLRGRNCSVERAGTMRIGHAIPVLDRGSVDAEPTEADATLA